MTDAKLKRTYLELLCNPLFASTTYCRVPITKFETVCLSFHLASLPFSDSHFILAMPIDMESCIDIGVFRPISI
jgi:hypothetical protein